MENVGLEKSLTLLLCKFFCLFFQEQFGVKQVCHKVGPHSRPITYIKIEDFRTGKFRKKNFGQTTVGRFLRISGFPANFATITFAIEKTGCIFA